MAELFAKEKSLVEHTWALFGDWDRLPYSFCNFPTVRLSGHALKYEYDTSKINCDRWINMVS